MEATASPLPGVESKMMSVPFADTLHDVPWLKSPASQKLLTALSADGHPVRFVGGCVRDGLLGHLDPRGDLDLATPARPDQIIALLMQGGIRAIPTGLSHGTVTAVFGDQTFEITTLREDVDCDGRHAKVRYTDDFAADAARRDFTINAMSVDIEGRLFDYFGGRADLGAGRVRFVGEAAKRVREDYLRILRFFRFFAHYGRPPADDTALEACREAAPGLKGLSGERIRVEMLKLLGADNPVFTLRLMIETGILRETLIIDPDLGTLEGLLGQAPSADALLRLAAVLRGTALTEEGVSALAERWRLANHETTRLLKLTLEPKLNVAATARKSRRDLYRLGANDYLDMFLLSAAETGAKAENIANAKGLAASWTSPKLPVRGTDLIERGVEPGPAIGKLLQDLEAWWLDQDMRPDRDASLEELERRLADAPPDTSNP